MALSSFLVKNLLLLKKKKIYCYFSFIIVLELCFRYLLYYGIIFYNSLHLKFWFWSEEVGDRESPLGN